jgi:putative ABC transport system ATP-binding protein
MDVLTLRDLEKNYPHAGGTVRVLQGVNATFSKGEAVAIVGPSGSGKSTLLSLMAGLDQGSSGSVLCMGQKLEDLSELQLTGFRAKHLSIVFQQFRLMPHMTALENVSLPLDLSGADRAVERAKSALDMVGLSHRINHFPRELSGGECQRVAIARALVTQPSILLADEPSGNLDTDTGRKVMDLLFELTRKHETTLILVTHDPALAARCDRQFVLNKGQLNAH